MAPAVTVADAVTVVCISDTHNSQVELPDGDILIHAGDLTQSGSFQELQATINWLRLQPHRHKFVVAGNHDLLLDDSCKHLYGSPLSRQNGNWAFQYPRADDVWSNVVPAETDILITHGPPRAHLDLLNLGCNHLLGELWRVRPALHVFGHVHEGYGQKWLNYDGVQEVFEKTVVARRGLVNVLTLLKEALRWCWTPFKAPETLLVNPAMAGGFRDKATRQPVVVVI
ncbi:Metallo-dependent phosphatase [Sarocladium strictum]